MSSFAWIFRPWYQLVTLKIHAGKETISFPMMMPFRFEIDAKNAKIETFRLFGVKLVYLFLFIIVLSNHFICGH